MVGIVVAVLGLSWWAMGETSSVGVAPKAQQIVGSAVPRDKEETASATAEPTPVPPSLVVHEIGRIRVSTPVGFRGEIEGEDVVFRGEDEGLRIRIAADPVLGVPAEVVMDEVRETVERDPTLSEANSPGLPQGDNPHEEKVTYREEPGDGSVVQWSTWVEAGHHMSVGCHTREASTVVQRAACRVAEESVGLL
ncbi:hypothetical protein Cocul_01055 [Corynebacterium oculi]|uniref:Type VII secretion-associated protein n=2 Tax=Corynebacterium oculi TaxID=1544416 RepID=A0A0N8VZL8_9CORY|nr:hypothetical protein Cocul_01055 [Corynebacterium oculi]